MSVFLKTFNFYSRIHELAFGMNLYDLVFVQFYIARYTNELLSVNENRSVFFCSSCEFNVKVALIIKLCWNKTEKINKRPERQTVLFSEYTYYLNKLRILQTNIKNERGFVN